MSDLTGGCACGAARFTAKGGPKFAFICQCRSCQHLSGSGHAVQFCHDATAFEFSGPVAGWSRQTDSGSTVTKMYCPKCASPLWGTTTRAPDIVMGLVGALDDPAAITPDRIFFADEAQPWDHASVPVQGADT
jgi:hypothetical protein